MKRLLIAVAAAAAVITAAACEPQMQISPVVNRDAFVRHTSSGDKLVVTGTISCTRSEPVDLFPTLDQGGTSDRPGEISVPCKPGDPARFTATFSGLASGFTAGSARLSIDFCTNPAEPIDEDCVTVARSVDLHVVSDS